ncbi:MAG: hypothetical protein ACON5B_02355 [Myxococcota bacterium]
MHQLKLLGLLWAGIAHANPETCFEEPEAPLPSTVSVAWISPVAQRVPLSGTLSVVPTRELRAWLEREQADVGRMLQAMGLRKRSITPKRPYKVTITEVPTDALCRPIDHEAPDDGSTVSVGGIALCPKGDAGLHQRHDACGRVQDRADGSPGLQVFRVSWKNAANQGFCVLPAKRFVRGR